VLTAVASLPVPPMAGLTATATLVLAGITFALAAATVALVLVTRAGTAQARVEARAELKVLERQMGAGYRPLLVDVLVTAPVPSDMGARDGVERAGGPNETVRDPGLTVETKLPGIEPTLIDPRSAFVEFQAGKIYVSVPLRNVGRGLAVIDAGGVELTGPLVGPLEYRTVQRCHVPVGETTRIDLICVYLRRQAADLAEQGSAMRGIAWQLAVPYCDFAGEQRTVASLQIVCRGEDVRGPWFVERVEQKSARDQEPHGDERPAEVSPAPIKAGRHHEPVVDLWGNPITKRKGRNR
jgi:hypothetical protein